ncbi:helix-turn-helix transcriptional regulator [Pantoea agglomerans]|uniref:helix-turn-helix transcriptional regulator n=1 Tax=Enterobacter agglomerans TaxID=549 RepID=UPI0017859A5D|nr:AlpA family phage regulatory protein [Pantoea agglomerans]MBD8153333.1 AlpA family phage regulatory protein [Pantoea agglomerans]
MNLTEQGDSILNTLTSKQHSDRIVREEECKHLTGLSRTTRFMLEKEGKFPLRRKIGGNRVGWLLSEISEWQQNSPKVSSNAA